MFNKNNNKTKSENEYLESVKFHTMKKDLLGENDNAIEESSDGIAEDYNKEGSPFLSKTVAINVENNLENKASDGLSKEADNIGARSGTMPKNLNSYPHIPTAETEAPPSVKNADMASFETLNEKSSTFIYGIIFVIILLLGAGGYYIWFMRDEKDNDISKSGITADSNKKSSANPENNSTNAIKDLADDKSGFSDKVNFMVVNDEEFDQLGIKSIIERKFIEMEKYSGNQLEFLVVDKNNKPILFKNFIDNFKIYLSPNVVNNLSPDNFSLFLYKNKDIKRVSVVVGTKNKDLLKTNLVKNERTLVKNIEALFTYAKPENISASKFGESNYNGNIIRYVNLNKSLDLSLDYAVVGDYLMVATNKESGRLIIDKLSKEAESKTDIFSSEN
ncbi:MAG: hypothetical protein UR66_C0003G0167 [Candidatus Moranbacteria bacterium GW2011_GWE1_35_17]|nr:MAG: hypothetical protein UR66_C0003G0167 [Candidatus Moranbacteria bacterium GW2011_GWE1_35_17]KKP84223.1 MAG: hypothetical protein UR83_C0025G0026 [Candidatus Moranbacteria bacterium GW2011_GWF2_35_54]KKP84462.1 MAG: hypothetical protein UR82_C0005G0004 [Candidatus Moranbacteria bacterium GW2011_GWF1_35_5]